MVACELLSNKKATTFFRMGLFSKKFTIVIVCKANITRSAYIHAYMEHYIKEYMPYARKKVQILSGGVHARGNCPASQVVKHVAKISGFSLRDHLSSKMSKKLVKKADLILVMEQYQKDEILKRFPKSKDKVFRMMEYRWAGDPAAITDIPDPTGQNLADYEEFMDVAHAEVERIFRELGTIGVL